MIRYPYLPVLLGYLFDQTSIKLQQTMISQFDCSLFQSCFVGHVGQESLWTLSYLEIDYATNYSKQNIVVGVYCYLYFSEILQSDQQVSIVGSSVVNDYQGTAISEYIFETRVLFNLAL